MAYRAKNLIVGAADIYLSLLTTPPPAPDDGEGYGTTLLAVSGAAWKHAGYTQDGLQVSYEPTWNDINVDQALDAARIYKSAMKLNVMTTFAEATLDNLLLVWGQDTSSLVHLSTPETGTSLTDTLTIEGGALGDAPNERQLVAVGNSVQTDTGVVNERIYYVARVLSVDTTAHSIKRDDPTVFPVTFRCLPQDDGTYGTIRNRAKVW